MRNAFRIVAFAAAVLVAGFSFASASDKDIVDTAVAAGQFETLVAAVQAAGLVETLKGDGPSIRLSFRGGSSGARTRLSATSRRLPPPGISDNLAP